MAGIAIRCVALTHPLLDAHTARQIQTATATESIIATPGFGLSAQIPWAGNIDARYVQELPIFNYLAILLYQAIGDIDISGKATAIGLWACSFCLLQYLWRRLLNVSQALWANVLFVIAPLGVFFGQAFMPEMLIQTLSLSFILLAFLYEETPTLTRWSLLVGIGAFGLLVKLPEFAHLYLILAWLLVRKARWQALLRPRYIIGAAVTLLAIKIWGTYVDSVNQTYLPEWTSPFRSTKYLRTFIGTWQDRVSVKRWAMVLLYLWAFVLPGVAFFITAWGFRLFLLEKSRRLLGPWLFSLGIFYLMWLGNGPASQSYYNLPALAPFCALFGLGLTALLGRIKSSQWRTTSITLVLLLVALPAFAACRHLFQQDKQTLAAADWIRKNTRANDVILFRPNHHWAAVSYPYNGALLHYSHQPTFVWTENTAPVFREAALLRSTYAIVTLPPPQTLIPLRALNRFRNTQPLTLDPLDWLEQAGFVEVAREPEFIAYRKK